MTHSHQRFFLLRNRDVDRVADGVLWADGSASIRWLGEHPSTVHYSSWEDLSQVHHVGKKGSDRWTTAQWLDGVCWICGADAAGALYGGNGGQCSACSSSWDGPPSVAQEPERGTWRYVGTLSHE